MSTFIDKLRTVGWGQGRGIGFGRDAAKKEDPLLLVARLDVGDLALAVDAAKQGATALVVVVGDNGLSQEQSKALSETEGTPWGLEMPGGGSETTPDDLDFVVVKPTAIAASLATDDDALPVVLTVPADMEEGLLGSLDAMAVEAVLVEGIGRQGEALTLRDLMALRRVRDYCSLPLIAAFGCRLEAGDLPHLRDCAIQAVLVNVVDRSDLEHLRELRRALRELPPAPTRRHNEALLPPVPGRPGARAEEAPELPD